MKGREEFQNSPKFLSFLTPGFTAQNTGNLKVLRTDMKLKEDDEINLAPTDSGVVTLERVSELW